MQNKAIKTKIT